MRNTGETPQPKTRARSIKQTVDVGDATVPPIDSKATHKTSLQRLSFLIGEAGKWKVYLNLGEQLKNGAILMLLKKLTRFGKQFSF